MQLFKIEKKANFHALQIHKSGNTAFSKRRGGSRISIDECWRRVERLLDDIDVRIDLLWLFCISRDMCSCVFFENLGWGGGCV